MEHDRAMKARRARLALVVWLACATAGLGCRARASEIVGPPALSSSGKLVRPPRDVARTPLEPAPAPPAWEGRDPEVLRLFEQQRGSASALASEGALPEVLRLALESATLGEAEGQRPSERFSVTLAEGRAAARALELPAESCLTAVARGGLGVGELDLVLEGPKGVVADDRRGGATAVLGGREGCVPLGGATRVTLYVLTRRGAGLVAVRTFLRP
jgi:hypothetical protein